MLRDHASVSGRSATPRERAPLTGTRLLWLTVGLTVVTLVHGGCTAAGGAGVQDAGSGSACRAETVQPAHTPAVTAISPPLDEFHRQLKNWVRRRANLEALVETLLWVRGRVRLDLTFVHGTAEAVQKLRSSTSPKDLDDMASSGLKELRARGTQDWIRSFDDVVDLVGTVGACHERPLTAAESALAHHNLSWGTAASELSKPVADQLNQLLQQASAVTSFRVLECEDGKMIVGWFEDRGVTYFVPIVPGE